MHIGSNGGLNNSTLRTPTPTSTVISWSNRYKSLLDTRPQQSKFPQVDARRDGPPSSFMECQTHPTTMEGGYKPTMTNVQGYSMGAQGDVSGSNRTWNSGYEVDGGVTSRSVRSDYVIPTYRRFDGEAFRGGSDPIRSRKASPFQKETMNDLNLKVNDYGALYFNSQQDEKVSRIGTNDRVGLGRTADRITSGTTRLPTTPCRTSTGPTRVPAPIPRIAQSVSNLNKHDHLLHNMPAPPTSYRARPIPGPSRTMQHESIRPATRDKTEVYHNIYKPVGSDIPNVERSTSYGRAVHDETLHFRVFSDGSKIPFVVVRSDEETPQTRLDPALFKGPYETKRPTEIFLKNCCLTDRPVKSVSNEENPSPKEPRTTGTGCLSGVPRPSLPSKPVVSRSNRRIIPPQMLPVQYSSSTSSETSYKEEGTSYSYNAGKIETETSSLGSYDHCYESCSSGSSDRDTSEGRTASASCYNNTDLNLRLTVSSLRRPLGVNLKFDRSPMATLLRYIWEAVHSQTRKMDRGSCRTVHCSFHRDSHSGTHTVTFTNTSFIMEGSLGLMVCDNIDPSKRLTEHGLMKKMDLYSWVEHVHGDEREWITVLPNTAIDVSSLREGEQLAIVFNGTYGSNILVPIALASIPLDDIRRVKSRMPCWFAMFPINTDPYRGGFDLHRSPETYCPYKNCESCTFATSVPVPCNFTSPLHIMLGMCIEAGGKSSTPSEEQLLSFAIPPAIGYSPGRGSSSNPTKRTQNTETLPVKPPAEAPSVPALKLGLVGAAKYGFKNVSSSTEAVGSMGVSSSSCQTRPLEGSSIVRMTPRSDMSLPRVHSRVGSTDRNLDLFGKSKGLDSVSVIERGSAADKDLDRLSGSLRLNSSREPFLQARPNSNQDCKEGLMKLDLSRVRQMDEQVDLHPYVRHTERTYLTNRTMESVMAGENTYREALFRGGGDIYREAVTSIGEKPVRRKSSETAPNTSQDTSKHSSTRHTGTSEYSTTSKSLEPNYTPQIHTMSETTTPRSPKGSHSTTWDNDTNEPADIQNSDSNMYPLTARYSNSPRNTTSSLRVTTTTGAKDGGSTSANVSDKPPRLDISGIETPRDGIITLENNPLTPRSPGRVSSTPGGRSRLEDLGDQVIMVSPDNETSEQLGVSDTTVELSLESAR